MMKNRLLLFNVLTLVAFTLCMATYSIDEIPNPFENPEACGMAFPSSVCDPNGYLGPEGPEKVWNAIETIHSTLRVCEKPPQVAVLVIDGFNTRKFRKPSSNDAFKFAREIFDRWGLGYGKTDVTDECQNGVLFLLAVEQRRMAVVTGKALKRKHITDGRIDEAFEVITPYLRSKHIIDATLEMVYQITYFIEKPLKFTWFFPIVIIGIISFFIFSFVMQKMKSRRYKRAEDMLHRCTDHSTSCPICLELYTDTNPAMTLPCGHTFHDPCIQEWLTNHDTCPLCRQTVLEGDDPSHRRSKHVGSRFLGLNPTYLVGDMIETQFRLQQFRNMHSRIMTARLQQDLLRHAQDGELHLASSRAWRNARPRYEHIRTVANVLSEIGATSSSSGFSSFGGGSSKGGGGRGGKW